MFFASRLFSFSRCIWDGLYLAVEGDRTSEVGSVVSYSRECSRDPANVPACVNGLSMSGIPLVLSDKN